MRRGDDLVSATFGENYDRLVEVKRRDDPTNLFQVNRNIPPRATVDVDGGEDVDGETGEH